MEIYNFGSYLGKPRLQLQYSGGENISVTTSGYISSSAKILICYSTSTRSRKFTKLRRRRKFSAHPIDNSQIVYSPSTNRTYTFPLKYPRKVNRSINCRVYGECDWVYEVRAELRGDVDSCKPICSSNILTVET